MPLGTAQEFKSHVSANSTKAASLRVGLDTDFTCILPSSCTTSEQRPQAKRTRTSFRAAATH